MTDQRNNNLWTPRGAESGKMQKNGRWYQIVRGWIEDGRGPIKGRLPANLLFSFLILWIELLFLQRMVYIAG